MSAAIPPLPQYVFIVWRLVKHRDNFTFTLEVTGLAYLSNYHFVFIIFVYEFVYLFAVAIEVFTVMFY